MEKPHGDMSSPPCLSENGFSFTLFQGIKHLSCLQVSPVKIASHNAIFFFGPGSQNLVRSFQYDLSGLFLHKHPLFQALFKCICDMNMYPCLDVWDFSSLFVLAFQCGQQRSCFPLMFLLCFA